MSSTLAAFFEPGRTGPAPVHNFTPFLIPIVLILIFIGIFVAISKSGKDKK